MTISEYLNKSDKLINYAKSINHSDPQKSKRLLSEQLNQHTKLLEEVSN